MAIEISPGSIVARNRPVPTLRKAGWIAVITGVALLALAKLAQKIDPISVWPTFFLFMGSSCIVVGLFFHCIRGLRECLGSAGRLPVLPYTDSNSVVEMRSGA